MQVVLYTIFRVLATNGLGTQKSILKTFREFKPQNHPFISQNKLSRNLRNGRAVLREAQILKPLLLQARSFHKLEFLSRVFRIRIDLPNREKTSLRVGNALRRLFYRKRKESYRLGVN